MHGDDHGSDHPGVLIVGAVPTELALQQAEVKHVLIDKLSHGQNASRTTVIRAHTFEGA